MDKVLSLMLHLVGFVAALPVCEPFFLPQNDGNATGVSEDGCGGVENRGGRVAPPPPSKTL